MKISKVQEAVSGLNRSWSRPCFAAFLLAVVGEATVAAVHGGEEDDINCAGVSTNLTGRPRTYARSLLLKRNNRKRPANRIYQN
jgi:hypothetical protein